MLSSFVQYRLSSQWSSNAGGGKIVTIWIMQMTKVIQPESYQVNLMDEVRSRLLTLKLSMLICKGPVKYYTIVFWYFVPLPLLS